MGRLPLLTLPYPNPHARSSIIRRQEKDFCFILEPNVSIQVPTGGLTQRFQLFGSVLPYDRFEIIVYNHDDANDYQRSLL